MPLRLQCNNTVPYGGHTLILSCTVVSQQTFNIKTALGKCLIFARYAPEKYTALLHLHKFPYHVRNIAPRSCRRRQPNVLALEQPFICMFVSGRYVGLHVCRQSSALGTSQKQLHIFPTNRPTH